MGGGSIKSPVLKKSELADFHNLSYFSNEVILNLYNKFSNFSAINKDDGVIDYEEFCVMTGKENNILTHKIFSSIDFNNDGRINFREFLKFLSCFISGSLEDQKVLSFRIFADEETNLIHKSFMFDILKKTLIHEGGIPLMEYFDEATLNAIVDDSFPNQQGEFLSLDEYGVILEKNQEILNWFKVDISKIKESGLVRSKGCFG
jgi:Ca2+-binding EF-hand superfamily protein